MILKETDAKSVLSPNSDPCLLIPAFPRQTSVCQMGIKVHARGIAKRNCRRRTIYPASTQS